MVENYHNLIGNKYQERQRNQIGRLRGNCCKALGLKENP